MSDTVAELKAQLAAAEAQNGTADNTIVKDNRYKIVVDDKQIQAWELAVMESTKISEWYYVLALYLENGNGPVSPDLPKKAPRKLTPVELAEIQNSKAYGVVEDWYIADIKAAVTAFSEGAMAGF